MIAVFDLSGVFFNDGMKVAVKKISRKYKLNPKNVEFVLNGKFSKKYRTGKINPEDFWLMAKKQLRLEDMQNAKLIFFDSYKPKEDTIKLIKRLRKKSVKAGFISNSPKDRAEYLNFKYGFIRLFDYGVFSFEARSWKPEKGIYRFFLDKYNLKPNDIVYTDDRERDLKPAKELGMKVILFKNVKQLEKELKELLN